MSSKKQELMSKIRWIIDKGAVHILGTNVVNKVLSFFTNIFIVRFLTKSEYGIFGYANNIISFFLLVSGLGCLVEYCSMDLKTGRRKKKNYTLNME